MNKTNELCEMELTADTEERLSVLKKKLGATDRYIQQDNRDLAELESRYEKLDISYPVDFWMIILHVCRRNTSVLQICVIWQG